MCTKVKVWVDSFQIELEKLFQVREFVDYFLQTL